MRERAVSVVKKRRREEDYDAIMLFVSDLPRSSLLAPSKGTIFSCSCSPFDCSTVSILIFSWRGVGKGARIACGFLLLLEMFCFLDWELAVICPSISSTCSRALLPKFIVCLHRYASSDWVEEIDFGFSVLTRFPSFFFHAIMQSLYFLVLFTWSNTKCSTYDDLARS